MPHYLEAEINKKCPPGSKFAKLVPQFKSFLDELTKISEPLYIAKGLKIDGFPETPFEIDTKKKFDANSDDYNFHAIAIINNACRYVFLDLFPDKINKKGALSTLVKSTISGLGPVSYRKQMSHLDINNTSSWIPAVSEKTYPISKAFLSLLTLICSNIGTLEITDTQVINSLKESLAMLNTRISQFEEVEKKIHQKQEVFKKSVEEKTQECVSTPSQSNLEIVTSPAASVQISTVKINPPLVEKSIDIASAITQVFEKYNLVITQLEDDKNILATKFEKLQATNNKDRENVLNYDSSNIQTKYAAYYQALQELQNLSPTEKTNLESQLQSILNKTVEAIANNISANFIDTFSKKETSLPEYITEKFAALQNPSFQLNLSITANNSQARLAIELVNDFHQLTQAVGFKPENNNSMAAKLMTIHSTATTILDKASVEVQATQDSLIIQQHQEEINSNKSELEELCTKLASNPVEKLSKSDKKMLDKYSLTEIVSSVYSLSREKDHNNNPIYTCQNQSGKNLKLAQAKIYEHLEKKQNTYPKLDRLAFWSAVTIIGIPVSLVIKLSIFIYDKLAKKNFEEIETSLENLNKQSGLMKKVHQKLGEAEQSDAEEILQPASSNAIIKIINRSYGDKIILKRQYYLNGRPQSEKPTTQDVEDHITFKGTYQQAQAYKYKEKALKKLEQLKSEEKDTKKEDKIIDELISNLKTLGK